MKYECYMLYKIHLSLIISILYVFMLDIILCFILMLDIICMFYYISCSMISHLYFITISCLKNAICMSRLNVTQ